MVAVAGDGVLALDTVSCGDEPRLCNGRALAEGWPFVLGRPPVAASTPALSRRSSARTPRSARPSGRAGCKGDHCPGRRPSHDAGGKSDSVGASAAV